MADTDIEMLKMIRAQPDADCWLLPASWYKKFGIEPVKAENPRDYMKRDYIGGLAVNQYGPPIIRDEPIRTETGEIKLLPVFPLEEVPIKTECRPFVGDASKLIVHPRLAEIAEEESRSASQPNTLSAHTPPRDNSPERHCADSGLILSRGDILAPMAHSD